MSSEINRLVHQIEAETMAMNRGLYGLASNYSRHAFVNARMQVIGQAYERLAVFVGDDLAKDILLTMNDDAATIARAEQDVKEIEEQRQKERKALGYAS